MRSSHQALVDACKYPFQEEQLKDHKYTHRFVIVEVYKTGEKIKRGRKPQGYNIYSDGVLMEYLPYGKSDIFEVVEKNEK